MVIGVECTEKNAVKEGQEGRGGNNILIQNGNLISRKRSGRNRSAATPERKAGNLRGKSLQCRLHLKDFQVEKTKEYLMIARINQNSNLTT